MSTQGIQLGQPSSVGAFGEGGSHGSEDRLPLSGEGNAHGRRGALEPGVRVKVAGTDVGTLVRTFGDVARGQLVALVGSGGTVEIAVRDGSAARMLGVGVGAEVRA